ncbi:MAG: alpha/beta hydrolase [Planctomycetaceae bacterium]
MSLENVSGSLPVENSGAGPLEQTDEGLRAAEAASANCPPPLAWRDVLTEFRRLAESFEFSDAAGHTVSGYVLGEGPPLYILNGLSATPEVQCLLVWLLREEFRCVIIEYPEDAASLRQLADALLLAADRFGDAEFDLFATSFGSAVALRILTQDSSRIRHAVLQGSVNGIRLSWLERCATWAAQFLPGQMKHLPLFRTALQNNHRLWFPPIDPTRWNFLVLNVGSQRIQTVARRLRMLHGIDWTSQLSALETPVFIISSEGEAERHRAAARLFADCIPISKDEQISNSGHVPFISHPHRLANLIGPFLRDE